MKKPAALTPAQKPPKPQPAAGAFDALRKPGTPGLGMVDKPKKVTK